ncbi:MAG: Gfo/Idh/MocA family oxidoreductase, partial [Clostridia bacterium]|nr:Gfo/Idh/MocA family oxidoreductase [Clostridia bacterium]
VIVGCAHMHVNEVALYIKGQPDSELLGVADVPAEMPENTEKRYTRAWNFRNVVENCGAKPYENYIEMLEDVKPDVAYVLTENYRKADIAEEIAKRGINVILEKPMAVTAEDARRIVALKERYGVEIYVNWPVTWRKYVREMKAMVDSGKLGKLQKLRYLNGHTGPLGKGAKHRGVSAHAEEMTDEERARTWWHQKKCGGGAYLDILCYGCYFSRWLFGGTPLDIMSVGENLNTPFGDTEDNIAALLRYEDGFAVAEGTWTTPRRRMPTGPEVVCSEGVVWCDGVPDGEAFAAAADIYGNDVTVDAVSDDDDFRNMPWHYAAHVLRGKPMHETLTAEFNADVIAMIEAAERSNVSRRAEKI